MKLTLIPPPPLPPPRFNLELSQCEVELLFTLGAHAHTITTALASVGVQFGPYNTYASQTELEAAIKALYEATRNA